MCFVNIFTDLKTNSGGCPCGPLTIGDVGKRYVVEVEAVSSHAGILSMPMTTSTSRASSNNNSYHTRHYYIYPGMVPNDYVVGDTTLL